MTTAWSPKILLVEDNEMNRDMLSRRLLRKGYEVELAVDGTEGVAKAITGTVWNGWAFFGLRARRPA